MEYISNRILTLRGHNFFVGRWAKEMEYISNMIQTYLASTRLLCSQALMLYLGKDILWVFEYMQLIVVGN